MRVSPFGNVSEDATDLFVFGEPELTDITSISGGVIEPKSNAKSTWLILPLTEAAPVFSENYDISGVLRYTIEGVWYTQGLASDTITVQPDPQLYLKYFHSREVFSDDPFTPIVEPSIPYQLGLLIENRGYGDAFNVNILSSQPEIVENEKGLLIDFSIIGSRLNNEVMSSSSLNINFGTIAGRNNSVGVWDMLSTLRGTFNNFSATFEYKGPINDDRLSLIESVEIYELTHIVRVDSNHPSASGLGYIDDGVGDFLANLNPDYAYIPDHVFTSDPRQSNFTVSSVLNKLYVTDVNQTSGSEMVLIIHHNMTAEEISMLTDWVYIRFEDELSGTGFALDRVIRTDDEYTLIPSFNSWQTAWTDYLASGDIEQNNYIHLFDFGIASEYRLVYRKPTTVTNLRVLESTESELTVAWDAIESMPSSYLLLKHANMGNQYFKVAQPYLPGGITSVKLTGLSSGTPYTIMSLPLEHAPEEDIGVTIEGTTLGDSLCGNGMVDMGEECDDGSDNGKPGVNCTTSCVYEIKSFTAAPSSLPSTASPTFRPSKSPSAPHSSTPSTTPSLSPTSPSSSPSKSPSRSPSHTRSPSNAPSIPPSTSPSASPSNSPSKSPKAPYSSTPSTSPSMSPTSPTSSPSKSPSRSPSHTLSPSNAPSTPPSTSPSASQSNSPSKSPSSLLSVSPSSSPSKSPSSSSSVAPSMSPSKSLSRLPSNSPSVSPSKSPSSASPSKTPTNAPMTPEDPPNSPSLSPTMIPVTTISMDSTLSMNLDCSTDLTILTDVLEKSLFETMSSELEPGELQDINVYELCGQAAASGFVSHLFITSRIANTDVSFQSTVTSQKSGNDIFQAAKDALQTSVSRGDLADSIQTNSGGTITAVISDTIVSTFEVTTNPPTTSPTNVPNTAKPTNRPTMSKAAKNSKIKTQFPTKNPTYGPFTRRPNSKAGKRNNSSVGQTQ